MKTLTIISTPHQNASGELVKMRGAARDGLISVQHSRPRKPEQDMKIREPRVNWLAGRNRKWRRNVVPYGLMWKRSRVG